MQLELYESDFTGFVTKIVRDKKEGCIVFMGNKDDMKQTVQGTLEDALIIWGARFPQAMARRIITAMTGVEHIWVKLPDHEGKEVWGLTFNPASGAKRASQ